MLSVKQELTFRLVEALIISGKINPLTLPSETQLRMFYELGETIDLFLQVTKEKYQSDQDISLGKYLGENLAVMANIATILEDNLKPKSGEKKEAIAWIDGEAVYEKEEE